MSARTVRAGKMRDRMFTMRVTDAEVGRMDAVAAKYGLNKANLFRFLLKREHDAIEEERAAKALCAR